MTKLFINGLHWETTATKLQAFLEAWKLHPDGVRVHCDADGISRRFATAEIPAHELEAARGLTGKRLDGEAIRVSRAGDKRGSVKRTRQR